MKILTLSRSKLELAQFQLRRPLIVVGRSPTCDVVLRAPGIQPIHFIIEWIGNGKFDPKAGMWSIADVSQNAEAGEGLVLGSTSLTLGDITFSYVESQLESSEVIGGRIVDNLSSSESGEPELLEFVQVRNDSGAIEEVRHVPISKKHKIESISQEFKAFKIEHSKLKTSHLLTVLLQELPGAELFLSGKKIDAASSVVLRANDFLQVKWNGRDFYLRFVDEVRSPPVPQDFFGDPLLKYLTAGAAVLLLIFFQFRSHLKSEPVVEAPPPRIARVELPPPPPKPPEPEAKPQVVESKPEAVEKIEKAPVKKPPAKAAAPAIVKAPKLPPKAGLNTPAKVANVNQIGLLATLNKNSKKGPGVRADQVINQGMIRETLPNSESSGVVLQNPPSGILGKGKEGAPNGKASDSLGAASTTLSGVKTATGDSKSLIARAGGTGKTGVGGFAASGVGTGISGDGKSSRIGEGAGDFSVEGGGLDRDTVRRIILSYRGQIRACYERALISAPNLKGRVVYKWKILSAGAVVEAKVARTDVDSSNLKGCVLEVIQQMQFPKSPKGLSTTVIYPFVFQGQN